MKKRFLIPAVSFAALSGLFFVGYSALNADVDQCNKGDLDVCQQLANKHLGKIWNDKVTNEAFPAMLAKRVADKATADKASQVDTASAAQAKPVSAKPQKTGTKGMSNYEACLYNKAQLNELQAGFGDKSYDCASVKDYKTPAQRIAAAGGQTQLIRGCEAILKPSLKDPNSYRYLNGRIVAKDKSTLEVNVQYTATNSFGGRVQNVHVCEYKA